MNVSSPLLTPAWIANTDPEIAPVHPTSSVLSDTEFEQLLTDHHAGLLRWFRSRLRHAEDAEDLTQETEKRAWCHRHTFDDRARYSAWLFAIARHRLVDFIRKRDCDRRLRVEQVATARAQDAGNARGMGVSVHRIAAARERLQACLECVTWTLPLPEQVAVLLSAVHDYTGREAAARQPCSLPYFKKLLHNARVRMVATHRQPCRMLEKAGVAGSCPVPGRYRPLPSRKGRPHGRAGAWAPREALWQVRDGLLLRLKV